MSMDYTFPVGRLRETMEDPSKTPVVLVACGSFSPITYLHLRMFEVARDDARTSTNFEVVGGYLSPVNDTYNKPGLARADHRIAMCSLACEHESAWIAVDDWEARQSTYTPTARVLDHFDQCINGSAGRNGIEVCRENEETGEVTFERRKIKIMLLAGSDLIQTMSQPGVWQEKDLHHILNLYGCYIIQRADSDIDQALFNDQAVHSRSPLALYRDNIYQVQQLIRNDVSSTKIRLFVSHDMSIRYLIPTVVIDYIKQHNLYSKPSATSQAVASTSSGSPGESSRTKAVYHFA